MNVNDYDYVEPQSVSRKLSQPVSLSERVKRFHLRRIFFLMN